MPSILLFNTDFSSKPDISVISKVLTLPKSWSSVEFVSSIKNINDLLVTCLNAYKDKVVSLIRSPDVKVEFHFFFIWCRILLFSFSWP